MISILDLGLGNTLSVFRMVARVGGSPRLVERADDLDRSSRVILPGVGAFDAGASALRQRGFDQALREIASSADGRILGLCLGMQLLLESSEEGLEPGLGLIKGTVKRLPSPNGERIPHMGWNFVSSRRSVPLIATLPEPSRFYFVHSYAADVQDSAVVVLATTHGVEFPAAIQAGGVMGGQFHPEKSHRFGMEFLRGFLRS